MEPPAMLVPTTNVVGSPASSAPFIHRYYILLKAHYFLFFSAFGILYPVLSITLRSRGLSNTEISYINIIIPFLAFFTNPFIGFIADHSRRYILTFNLILGIVTILYAIMFILPSMKTRNIQADVRYNGSSNYLLDFCASEEVATKCSSRSECGCSYGAYCKKDNFSFNFTFSMSLTDARETKKNSIGINDISTCGIEYRVPIDKYIQNYYSNLLSNIDNTSRLASCEITCSIAQYCHGIRYPQQTHFILLYSLLFILGTNLLTNTITIGTSIGFAALPRPDIFGQQRVWGTVGFGVSAFLASRLYVFFNTEFVYIIMFSISTILCIIVTAFIRIQVQKHKLSTSDDDMENNEPELKDINIKNTTNETKKKDVSQHKIAALIPLMKKLDVIVFLSLTFIWGMSYAGLDPYVYLYIDEIAPCQSRGIVGWMSLIAASSEVIALFLAGRMIKSLGTNLCSVIILIAFVIRFSGYYFIRRPYFILFIETMHYFNFGILYVLISQKADAIAPPGLAGTLQGVVYGVSFGLGRGVGLIISSVIYTRFQPRSLFLFFASFNAIAAGIYSLYFLFGRKRAQKTNRSNNNPNIPKIIIESEPNIPEEPFISSTTNKIDNKFIEQ